MPPGDPSSLLHRFTAPCQVTLGGFRHYSWQCFKFHVSGTLEYVAFCVWLLSPSTFAGLTLLQ